MNELPENQNLRRQIEDTLVGRTVTEVFNATKPHSQVFWYGDQLSYGKLLTGRRIESSETYGMFVDLVMDKHTKISIGDGTNLKYGTVDKKMPASYQLLCTLDDNTYIVLTVGMFGFIAAYDGTYDEHYYQNSLHSVSPLSNGFDERYFDDLFAKSKATLSAKLFLAAEQRIPGIGNGVLQDILFNARVHPKRKLSSLSDAEKSAMFHSVKDTLKEMTAKGGRDTETDLFGNKGGYRTILSKNTVGGPCPVCGDTIMKEASSGGGAIYYCPTCQRL